MGQFDPSSGLNVFDLGLHEAADPYYDSLVCFQRMADTMDASNPYISIMLTEVGTSTNEFLSSEATLLEGQIFPTLGIEVAPVPEPATILLLGSGLAGLAAFRRKFRKK